MLNGEGYSREYSCVLQDGSVHFARKVYAEINKTAAGVGGYLIDVEHMYIDEQGEIEYYAELAEWYHPLLDGKGVNNVDFLVVPCASLMSTDADFVSVQQPAAYQLLG